MDSLFSILGLYQLSALVFPGWVAVTGAYYAVWGLPPDPSTAAVLGIIALSYVAGNVVQGTAVLWEGRYWGLAGGWPSTRRMTPDDAAAYDPALRAAVQAKLDLLIGSPTGSMPVRDRFALARAELRKQGQDGRSEALNAIYALSRGLATSGAFVAIVMLACAIVGHAAKRDLIAAAIIAACVGPVMVRFHRFSRYFADQVWHDFAALSSAQASP
jgi:hypothetical protein